MSSRLISERDPDARIPEAFDTDSINQTIQDGLIDVFDVYKSEEEAERVSGAMLGIAAMLPDAVSLMQLASLPPDR